MKVRHKLPIAFAAISLLVAFAGLFGIYQLNNSNRTYAQVIQVDVQGEQAVAAMLIDFKTQVQEWKNVLLTRSSLISIGLRSRRMNDR